jgi:hypothetical protein
MKRIRTSESAGLLRLTLIVCALMATVAVRSGIAADEGPKVTVVFDHALPNVPGKSIKGILVIPGHGPIGNKSKLIEFRDMLVTIREKVAALKKQGKSPDEVVAAKPTANYDANWGGFVINGDFFTRLVYAGV